MAVKSKPKSRAKKKKRYVVPISRGVPNSGACEAYCVDGSPPASYLGISPDLKKRWLLCGGCAVEAQGSYWTVIALPRSLSPKSGAKS